MNLHFNGGLESHFHAKLNQLRIDIKSDGQSFNQTWKKNLSNFHVSSQNFTKNIRPFTKYSHLHVCEN